MATIEDNSLTHAGVSGRGGFAVTPSDTVNFAKATRSIIATGAGNVVCIFVDGTQVTIPFTAGQQRDLALKRINATLTTATGLIGLY